MPQNTDKLTLLQDEFLKLPQVIREWVASTQVGGIIEDMNENAGIYSFERRVVIPNLIFRLVTKDLPPVESVAVLISELKIKPADAERLSEEIAERIFAPIKQSLLELGIDVGQLKKVGGPAAASVAGNTFPPPPSLPGAVSNMSAEMSQKELDNLAKKHNSRLPENKNLAGTMEDRTAILEMQKKKMETTLDVGGKSVVVPQTTALPSRGPQIDANALPTFREEGDMTRPKEEVSLPAEIAPFMLHQENELERVASPQTFHSNVEVNYPRKTPAATLPVKIEIGAYETPKSFAPAHDSTQAAPAASPLTKKTETALPTSRPPIEPRAPVKTDVASAKPEASRMPPQPLGSNFFSPVISPPGVPKGGASPLASSPRPELGTKTDQASASSARTSRRTSSELPPNSSMPNSLPPTKSGPKTNTNFQVVPSPAVPTPKSDPKIQGNTLDLRNN